MSPSRTLSRGDVHLLLAGVLFGTYILVKLTDPADYGMTVHPGLDKVWSASRIMITAGWLLLALLIAKVRKGDARYQSFSYAAAVSTALGFVTLSFIFPASASPLAVFGSLAVYAATSGALCLKVQRPIPAALLGAAFFLLQMLVDGLVHSLTGAFQIH